MRNGHKSVKTGSGITIIIEAKNVRANNYLRIHFNQNVS